MAGIQHGRKDKLMRADWKQCALFITFPHPFYRSGSFSSGLQSFLLSKCSCNLHCVNRFTVTEVKTDERIDYFEIIPELKGIISKGLNKGY